MVANQVTQVGPLEHLRMGLAISKASDRENSQADSERTLRLTLAGPWLWAETVRLSSSSSALAREAPRLSQIIRFKLSSFSKLDRI